MDEQNAHILDDELKANNVNIIPTPDLEKIKPPIGEGKFGLVFKGNYKGNPVAIKKMIFEQLDKDVIAEVIGEIKNLQVAVLESTHVPKFYGVWRGKKGNHYNLIFEFIEGRPLREMMDILTFDEKVLILYQTCEIVNVLHKRKLYHRDIKP